MLIAGADKPSGETPAVLREISSCRMFADRGRPLSSSQLLEDNSTMLIVNVLLVTLRCSSTRRSAPDPKRRRS